MDWNSWFAIGFTLRCDERNSWQNQRLSAKPWLTIRCHRTQSNEPNCNKSRLNWQAMRRRAAKQRGPNRVRVSCIGCSAASGKPSPSIWNAPEEGYEPFTPSDPEALRAALRPGDVLLVEGNNHISGVIKYLTQSTWSHAALYVGPIGERTTADGEPLVLVEADPRPGRGRRAAVEIPALPHPHLPPDRTDRGRLRAGLHLCRRAHRLRLRREEHLRPAALSVPAAGAAALAAAHDGARLRPSDPHHLLGADRAGVRARALSDPAEGHAPGERGGAPRHPRDPPFVALRAARFRHLALFRAGQADHRARLRLPPHGLGAPAAHPRDAGHARRRCRADEDASAQRTVRCRSCQVAARARRTCPIECSGHTSARLRGGADVRRCHQGADPDVLAAVPAGAAEVDRPWR